MTTAITAVVFFLSSATSVIACTFCAGSYAGRQTIRERSAGATIIVHGTLADSQFTADGKGSTNLLIGEHLKIDSKWGKPDKLTIPQYLPVIGDTPRDYLVFANLVEGKIDVTGGLSVPTAAIDYIKGCEKQLTAEPTKRLAFYFQNLDSKNEVVAGDAFLEFAKASDQEIAKVAHQFDVKAIRKWLSDPATPAERLGVYAVLLGLCGTQGDEAIIKKMIDESPRSERVSANLGGLLAGLTIINSKTGWSAIQDLATNAKAPFNERLAAIGTIRYFEQTRSKESKAEILSIYRILAGQGDFADVVAEDLRRWGWWDLTADVLSPFQKPSHQAPIIRQAIVRYALTCPNPEAKDFLAQVRKSDAALVERVEEGLKRFAPPKP